MVSVCAETEMQMGMGFPAIAEVSEYTPGPSLGIDCGSGWGGDMISHSRLVLQASRWRADERWLPAHGGAADNGLDHPRRIVITVNGAKATSVSDAVGMLSPGKRADIVLLEMGGVSQAGWNRRESGGAIIAQANSGNVDTVLVDGRIVKRGGSLVHVDVAAALAQLKESHGYLYEQMDRNGGFIPQPPIDIPLYRDRT